MDLCKYINLVILEQVFSINAPYNRSYGVSTISTYMFTPSVYLNYFAAHYTSFSTATLFPDGHFNMSALDRLEKVASISIFNKLAPSFLELASALDFDESTVDSLRQENNPVEGSKAMFKAWFSGKSSLPPTWKVLLEKLQATHMEELAQEIDRVFCDVSVTSSLSLVSHA